MIPVLVRAGALTTALVALYLLVRVLGSGVGTVLVGMLGAVALLAGTLVWAARDARRSSTAGPVLQRWVAVVALLVGGYVLAGLVAPGSYGAGMPLLEIVGQAVVLGGLLFLLPAVLGIARGSSLRRS